MNLNVRINLLVAALGAALIALAVHLPGQQPALASIGGALLGSGSMLAFIRWRNR